ncbi:MAG: phosphoribosylformylglycinamidine synthase subunit PurL [Phycisphaerae bacterium]|nr:phosphoribosylformylglycinamidine synthase subunit PurL [Phycisphaerae bacterium]
MTHRIEIRTQEGVSDPHAAGVAAQIRELGIDAVAGVAAVKLYFLTGELSADDARCVATELLADPVTEQWTLIETGDDAASATADPAGADGDGTGVIEVHLKPGVMDPVAGSTVAAIADMGLSVASVRTGRRYEVALRKPDPGTGEPKPATRRQERGAGPAEPPAQAAEPDGELLETIATKLLANPVIEDIHYARHTPPEARGQRYELQVVEVPIRELDDAGLEQLSADGELFLDLTEMQAIQAHYRALGREPRDVELEMIAQTWSEHCVHKTFRSDVVVRDADGAVVEEINNLIKSTIFAATQKLAKPWCISVFEDNAGVITFDEQLGKAVCFKVETHNHPSAIEPYGGASTGIGGVIRDPLGTGLGARPVANTDVFCFGPPATDPAAVPRGALHPRRVMRGVVSGVRDYGNRMGIPTLNGAVYFDRRYIGNPLVFCGTVGLMDRDKCFGAARSGDAILLVGGRTGRDGIHGATFSSGELTHTHETAFSHAVQIGNAITEKKMVDAICQARDAGLHSAITDCGAGGLSSAVGEMGAELGAEVHLDRVPLKYAGLSYDEIWISEAQERMVLAVPEENVDRIRAVFAAEEVEATVIGHFGTDDGHLRLYYDGTEVGDVDLAFAHEGLPRPRKEAVVERTGRPSPPPPRRSDYGETLLRILAAPNVASKEWIIRQYDHEVQGGSVVKPLVGADEDAPGDAAVIRPVLSSRKGLVIACGMNPRYGSLDAYQSALHAVDEALRNAIAVGGNLDRTAILDNFCWGNCAKPDRMGALVRAATGCRDAALAYGTPFISGKDSLNNEFRTDDGRTIAIPPTLLISAISVVDDAARCVTADAKEAGNHVFILGRTGDRLGGSHLLAVEGVETGSDVPPVDCPTNARTMRALQAAIESGCVRSCHDLSEGGLAVAAAEMAFGGALGVALDLAAMPTRGDAVGAACRLFAEDAGRFLVEVRPDQYDAFLRAVQNCPVGELGRVIDDGRVRITVGDARIDVSADDAKAAWQGTFAW